MLVNMNEIFDVFFAGSSGLPLLWIGVLGLLILITRALIQSIYNAFFHPLSSIPGPALARFTGHLLDFAQIRGDRAQVRAIVWLPQFIRLIRADASTTTQHLWPCSQDSTK